VRFVRGKIFVHFPRDSWLEIRSRKDSSFILREIPGWRFVRGKILRSFSDRFLVGDSFALEIVSERFLVGDSFQ
jgi:hypothetical protein